VEAVKNIVFENCTFWYSPIGTAMDGSILIKGKPIADCSREELEAAIREHVAGSGYRNA
jgi:hypothetical protein